MDRERLIKDYSRFLTDFEYFVTDCLGISKSDKYGYTDLTAAHRELCAFLLRGDLKTKMVLMPRYSFKSTITTIGKILWDLVRNPNERILIYSDSAAKAANFLTGIKAHIEGTAPNSKFRDYFYGWETDPKGGKWNESEIIISAREVGFPEASVETAGIETSKVGKHFDRVYFDDIVSDLNVTTKAQMDKVYECYQKALSLLTPTGSVILTGTRWAFGDPYGRIIEENKGNKKFGLYLRAAEENGEYPFESIGLTKDFLIGENGQRKKQGSYVYSCLYQNNPISDEDALFKAENFKFYKTSEIDVESLHITATVDPAGEGEDYTGISVVGTDDELNIYILELVNKHLKPNQIVSEIIRLSYKWKFSKLGVETNFFRGLLEKEIQLATEEERKNVNWKPFSLEVFQATAKRGESKHNRIRALQPYHERGDIFFPCDDGETVDSLRGPYYELALQMMQYTESHRPQFDDILDSVAWQLRIIRPGGRNIRKDLPRNSIAYIIKKEQDKYLENNRRLPLKYRKNIELFV